MTEPARQDRLETLAEFLLTQVPACNFNVCSWRSGRDHSDQALLEHKCNTTGCAVGWACVIPEFKTAGLLFCGQPTLYGNDIVFYGWDAVQKFFGLLQREAYILFSSDYYPTDASPEDVANRIRLFLTDYDQALIQGGQCLQDHWKEAGE